ncbi:MAG: Holliday junction branch migration protein RuvA [Bacilli bacterium]
MIINGQITGLEENFIFVKNNNITYEIETPNTAFFEVGKEYDVFCRFFLKEDTMRIFGFIDRINLLVFNTLNNITGIGPKISLNILRMLTINEIFSSVKNNDNSIFLNIPLVNESTSIQIVSKLKKILHKCEDKIDPLLFTNFTLIKNILKSIGYQEKDITNIYTLLIPSMSIEENIKIAIKGMKNG